MFNCSIFRLVLVRADNEKFKVELEKIAEIYREREEVKRKAEEVIEEQKKKMPIMPDKMLKGNTLSFNILKVTCRGTVDESPGCVSVGSWFKSQPQH